MDCPGDDALRVGVWPAEVVGHVEGCEACRERAKALRGTPNALDQTALAQTQASPRPPSARAPNYQRGQPVGRYIVTGLLGEGGMGSVYAAFDPDLNRKVALKFLRTDFAEAENASELRARLLREAQAMARLASPFVVNVHDVGTVGDQVWVAMEFVPGTTLTQWLRGKPRPSDEILAKFVEAGRGLAAAHAAGLVHRDFKPDNVLVGADGRARVSDFGLARAVDAAHRVEPSGPVRLAPSALAAISAPLTHVGALLGTPAYMAPEQFAGGVADARSDQFSFCVALYEALYGERPFAGDDLESLRAEVLAHRIRPPRAGAKVAARTRSVLLRGLSREPPQRFASMDALLRELVPDRPRSARGRVALGAMLATLASVALSRFVNPATPCEFGSEELGDAWSAARQASVAAAFNQSTDISAQDVWRSSREALERYASAWLAMRKDACIAANVKKTQTPAMMQLRMTCLDRRRSSLDALTALLAKSTDPTALLRAPEAIGNLPEVGDCADVARLQDGDTEDARARAAAAPLRKRLDAATARFDLGDWNDLAKETKAILADAPESNPWLHAEALLVDARVVKLNRLDDAANEFQSCVRFAMIARRDALAADCGVRMLDALQQQPQRFAALEPMVDALLARAGDPPRLRAFFSYSKGRLSTFLGDYRASAAQYAQVVEALPPGHPLTAIALQAQAADLLKTPDAPRALAIARRALDEEERTWGPEYSRLFWTLLVVARAELESGHLNEARALVTRANHFLPRMKVHGAAARAAWTSARVAEAEGRYAEAEKQLVEVLAGLGDPGWRGEFSCDLARIFLEDDKLDQALTWAEASVDSYTRYESANTPDLADPLTVRAGIEHARGQTDAARRDVERAMELRKAGNDPPGLGAATRFLLARLTNDRALANAALALDRTMRPTSNLQNEIQDWLDRTK